MKRVIVMCEKKNPFASSSLPRITFSGLTRPSCQTMSQYRMTHSSPPRETWRELISQSPGVPSEKFRWWLSDLLDCPLTQLPLDSRPDSVLRDRFLDALQRLERNEPVQYICGKAPFLDFEVRVTPDVLIPRPETEQLVDRVLQQLPDTPLNILDVGTGSGCIAIALKRARPQWTVRAVDLSKKALAVARENARILGAEISFSQADLLRGLPPNSVDGIVANLPYIGEAERGDLPAEVRDHEPGLALFADHDGTALVLELMRQARTVLRASGRIFLETGEHQTAVYRNAAAELGWHLESFRDLADRERFHVLSY